MPPELTQSTPATDILHLIILLTFFIALVGTQITSFPCFPVYCLSPLTSALRAGPYGPRVVPGSSKGLSKYLIACLTRNKLGHCGKASSLIRHPATAPVMVGPAHPLLLFVSSFLLASTSSATSGIMRDWRGQETRKAGQGDTGSCSSHPGLTGVGAPWNGGPVLLDLPVSHKRP